jgi:transcription initiation factor TFIIH subunit 2
VGFSKPLSSLTFSPFISPSIGQFGVAMNEGHFKDLLFELIPPPAQRTTTTTATSSSRSGPAGGGNPTADLMMMGFPTRLPNTSPPSLCTCHSELKSEGYLCPRCLAKMCDVPTDCEVCQLMIVSSPHLARSYHHLFPVKSYEAMYVLHLRGENLWANHRGYAIERALPTDLIRV